MKEFEIKKNDAGQRLDKFLTKAVKGLPASLMYKYIRTKKIKVNRARAEQKYMLCEGDEIQLFIRDEFFESPESDRGALFRIVPKLDIVYEDENIMLLNKLIGFICREVHHRNTGETCTHTEMHNNAKTKCMEKG